MRIQNSNSKIFVAGHGGLVGSAVVRRLEREGFSNLLLRTSTELDLRSQVDVNAFFASERPEFVVLAAARVGGILANSQSPVPFLQDNLAIELNVIRAAHDHGVTRLLFLGSSCVYPRLAPQPLKEEYLLTGALEPTNQWYAIAKIAGIKLCEAYRKQFGSDFVSLMPSNLYGPNDNFDLQSSHVLPALIRKFHESKSDAAARPVVIWGSGTPLREFLFIDDLADACLHVLRCPATDIEAHSHDGLLNIGTGQDLSIKELAHLIRRITGAESTLSFDASMPDGTPRKLMDVSRINRLGWEAKTSLEDGIRQAYEWFLEHEATPAD